MSKADEELAPTGPGALRTQWTRLLLHGLTSGGVRHVVISPGSRNTPLSIAFLRDPRFTCHSVIDERSAAFFGLGLARELDCPVVLCCTSGTAGAHYLPALIEAQASCISLLALTADRPVDLQGCGAEQTIEQRNLFGSFAPEGPPIPEPVADEKKLRAVLQQAARAVHASRYPIQGPVHINVPVAKPLEPRPPETAGEALWEQRVAGWLRQGPTRLFEGASPTPELRAWVDALHAVEGPLVMTLGPCSFREAQAARAVAEHWKVPLLAEFAQAGAAAPLEELVEDWCRLPEERPARVLHVGAPAVFSGWATWQSQHDPDLWLLPGPRLRDPSSRASSVLLGPLEETLRNCIEIHPTPKVRNDSFAQRLGARSEAHRQRLEAELSRASRDASQGASDVLSMYALLSAVGPETRVVLGNSLPIRNAALVSPLLEGPRRLVMTRGVNGIDGTLAAAAGTCVASGQPTLTVVGDVTAAHDLSSLALARLGAAPLVVCVLDNGGGRIFDQLPAAQLYAEDPETWKFWATPPEVDWSAAARTYGLAFAEIHTCAEVASRLSAAWQRARPTLLHWKTTGGTLDFRRRLAESRAR